MKIIVLDYKRIAALTEQEVVKDKDYDATKAYQGMRNLLLNVFVTPMEAEKQANLEFLYSYTKIKDALRKASNDPDIDKVELEDSDFELLHKQFKEFKDWNLGIARVILTASELLKDAANEKNLKLVKEGE